MNQRLLVDTAIFVYARGGEHRYRKPCRRIVRALADGSLSLEASTEMVQEFAHLLRRRDVTTEQVRSEAVDVAAACLLHGVEPDDLRAALDLLVQQPRLHVRDAVHAATATRRGIPVIVSPDHAFDGLPGVARLDPIDLALQLDG